MLKKIINNQKGAIFAEYGLLVTLIAAACAIAVLALGEGALALFETLDLDMF